MSASKHYFHSAHKGRKICEIIVNKNQKKKRHLEPLDTSKADWSCVTRLND